MLSKPLHLAPRQKGGPQGGQTCKRHDNIAARLECDAVPAGTRELSPALSVLGSQAPPQKKPLSPRGRTSRPRREGPRVGVRAHMHNCPVNGTATEWSGRRSVAIRGRRRSYFAIFILPVKWVRFANTVFWRVSHSGTNENAETQRAETPKKGNKRHEGTMAQSDNATGRRSHEATGPRRREGKAGPSPERGRCASGTSIP